MPRCINVLLGQQELEATASPWTLECHKSTNQGLELIRNYNNPKNYKNLSFSRIKLFLLFILFETCPLPHCQVKSNQLCGQLDTNSDRNIYFCSSEFVFIFCSLCHISVNQQTRDFFHFNCFEEK